MTAPRTMSVTDRYALRALKLLPSQVCHDGKIMWLKGRKIIGYGTMENVGIIPREADGAMISRADYERVMA
jgi:hypothetical protein